LKAL
jgi:hypothetical protein